MTLSFPWCSVIWLELQYICSGDMSGIGIRPDPHAARSGLASADYMTIHSSQTRCHEINSHKINWHQINSHEINLPRDQLNFFLMFCFMEQENHGANTKKFWSCWGIFELAYHKSQLLSQCVLSTNLYLPNDWSCKRKPFLSYGHFPHAAQIREVLFYLLLTVCNSFFYQVHGFAESLQYPNAKRWSYQLCLQACRQGELRGFTRTPLLASK